MRETERGLVVTGRFNLESETARAAYEALLGGSLSKMSIGFTYRESDTVMDGDTRVFLQADVVEGSLVTSPANPRATVLAVRSRTFGTASSNTATLTYDVKAAEDVALMREHLRAVHGRTFTMVGRPMGDMILVHRVQHAGLGDGASEAHIMSGNAWKGDAIDAYRRRLYALTGKSDAELRAEVNRLYDECFSPGDLRGLDTF